MIFLSSTHKYLLIILILSCSLFVNGQFNTVKQLVKPVLKPSDPTWKMQNDSSTVDKYLDSISWRLVMEQFQRDTYKRDTAQTLLRFYLPLRSIQITSPFGNRFHPIEKVWKMHNGVDLKAYYEPVFAVADGIVKVAGYKEKEGNYIVISHGDVESIYCHLSVMLCSQGQYMKGGSCIGISGNSGLSTGPHLHFGINYKSVIVDPVSYINWLNN